MGNPLPTSHSVLSLLAPHSAILFLWGFLLLFLLTSHWIAFVLSSQTGETPFFLTGFLIFSTSPNGHIISHSLSLDYPFLNSMIFFFTLSCHTKEHSIPSLFAEWFSHYSLCIQTQNSTIFPDTNPKSLPCIIPTFHFNSPRSPFLLLLALQCSHQLTLAFSYYILSCYNRVPAFLTVKSPLVPVFSC